MMDNVQMIRGQAARIQMEKKMLPAMSHLSLLWSPLARPAGCAPGSSSPELVGSNKHKPCASLWLQNCTQCDACVAGSSPAPLVWCKEACQRHGKLSAGFLPHPHSVPGAVLGLRSW